jgi:hypothetical protein
MKQIVKYGDSKNVVGSIKYVYMSYKLKCIVCERNIDIA